MFKFRSVRSIVIAPAKTGRERSRRRAVIATDQTKRGIRSRVIKLLRMFSVVEMKLIAPKIEEIPAKWSEKIEISTDLPAWARFLDSGGYTVQPVPVPLSIRALINRRFREGGSNQNLMLFIRGKAMSGAPIIRGTSQLPNPPIIIGITIKKIIIKACAVTSTL